MHPLGSTRAGGYLYSIITVMSRGRIKYGMQCYALEYQRERLQERVSSIETETQRLMASRVDRLGLYIKERRDA